MQDGVSAHRAEGTITDLDERNVKVIYWPPFSPDLNPIETVWDWMKDYIEEHYGGYENPGYDTLRSYVREAWDAVPEWYLLTLIEEMTIRCEAVIAANGGHTKY